MKKQLIAALVLVAAAIGATTPSWASFLSTQKSTVTAGTFVGGAKIARFTLTYRDTSNPFNGVIESSITWSGVSSGLGWKIADRLLVINSTVTDLNGGIQIYTENTAADASPKFVLPDPTHPINKVNAAAGLLQGTSGTTSTALPMAWSIKSSTKEVEVNDPVNGIGAQDPNATTGSGYNNPFQWLFVTDSVNTSGIDNNDDGNVTSPGDQAPFVNAAPYITPIRVGGGLEVQQDGTIQASSNGANAYMYLQANFASAAAQTAYQTTTLRVEAFIQ